MAEPSLDSDSREASDSPPRMPLWVKVLGIFVLVVVLVFFFQLFTSGPMRGPMPPGAHLGLNGLGAQAPVSSVAETPAHPGGDRG